ncbi:MULTISPECIES: hypothetical protein [unclassified Microbacterium]|nr:MULTISPECIES: hypothetical protein [unclassified Microbacterium]MBT2486197.1 hypothetical protein [Microbacterium sp. ISL-108]
MKPDELWLAQDGNFTQVLRKGPAARFAGYAVGVIELLIGPALRCGIQDR